MKCLSIAIFLSILCVNSSGFGKCGNRTNNELQSFRIVGGHNASPGSWPWMATIRLKLSPLLPVCGATLINDNWILTAAHCLHVDDNPLKWSAVLGDYDIGIANTTELTVDVNKIIIHPKYSIGNGIFNDIALLKLNQLLDFNGKDKHLAPICLPNDTNIDLTSAQCVITGWGYLKADGSAQVLLQEAVVPVLTSKSCFEKFGFQVDINTCICAGGLQSGGLGTCIGDSGGPLQCQMNGNHWFQLGIISWGKACAIPGIPDVYTKVSAYSDWIEEVINKN